MICQEKPASDRDKDGRLTKSEAAGLIQPHFETIDTNQGGYLQLQELKVVSGWLNHHTNPARRRET